MRGIVGNMLVCYASTRYLECIEVDCQDWCEEVGQECVDWIWRIE
jgi:hypothetical protein